MRREERRRERKGESERERGERREEGTSVCPADAARSSADLRYSDLSSARIEESECESVSERGCE